MDAEDDQKNTHLGNVDVCFNALRSLETKHTIREKHAYLGNGWRTSRNWRLVASLWLPVDTEDDQKNTHLAKGHVCFNALRSLETKHMIRKIHAYLGDGWRFNSGNSAPALLISLSQAEALALFLCCFRRPVQQNEMQVSGRQSFLLTSPRLSQDVAVR